MLKGRHAGHGRGTPAGCAMKIDGRWIIVPSVAQDIGPRKRAEQAAERQGRMYAALSATNEAIMRATSPEDLYQRVCDAAVNGGKFLTTAVMLPQAGSASVVAISGVAPQALRESRVPLEGPSGEGQGLVGTAFWTCAALRQQRFSQGRAHAPLARHRADAGIKPRPLRFRSRARARPSACCCFTRGRSGPSTRRSSNCSSAWRRTSPSRSTISSTRTSASAPRSASSTSPRTTA